MDRPRRTQPSRSWRPGRRRRAITSLAVALGSGGLLLSSCGSSPPDGLPPTPGGAAATAYTGNGPYAPGVRFLTTAAGDPVVVTYPVDRSATAGHQTYTIDLLRWFLGTPNAPVPASLASLGLPTSLATDAYRNLPVSTRGTFPVVLFSHGFGGYPEQSSFLTDHLATWGFVVVAPDHRSRDLHAVLTGTTRSCACDVQDLRDALALIRQENGRAGSPFHGRLDLSRVAAVGHSAGGGAAITVAGDPAVRTYVGLAPADGTVPPAGKPGMIMQGLADTVVMPSDARALYARLHAPKRLVLIAGAGHNAFDDGCTIGAAQGGLVTFVAKLGLPAAFTAIATDGCSPPDVAPPKVWPLIDQAVTAQLRWGLGIDPQPVGLGSSLSRSAPGVAVTVSATS